MILSMIIESGREDTCLPSIGSSKVLVSFTILNTEYNFLINRNSFNL